MQPETSSDLSEVNEANNRQRPSSIHQYGSNDDESVVQSPSGREDNGHLPESGSEWSLSQSNSPGQDPSSDDDTWLKLAGNDFQALQLDNDGGLLRMQNVYSARLPEYKLRGQPIPVAPFDKCPEEVLFHVFSHLSASDLLLMKLVSRRFHNLVTSPLAWITAFSNYFPGQNALRAISDNVPGDETDKSRKPVMVVFTRLTGAASWTGEFLVRAKLLRCLARGRPSIPFAATSPGKPHKGFATFTFRAANPYYVDRLDAQFGDAGDKRLPLFMHGMSEDGTVSCSDKRGTFDSWGQKERRMFRNADGQFPGIAKWGLGSGEFVLVPNVMDVSSRYGMVVGEGVPGGNVHYLANGEKRGRFLAPHPEAVQRDLGNGSASPPHMQSVTSVWIAKSPTIPRMSCGLIGIFSGSSSGIVSAYSLGISVNHGARHEKGELVARWILSPGIPIVSIRVDEEYSTGSLEQRRIWAVALNALGEAFHINDFPSRATLDPGQHNPDAFEELRAWETAKSAVWSLIGPSRRSQVSETQPVSRLSVDITQPSSKAESDELVNWLKKSPSEIRSLFRGWDMRRRLEVDFGGSIDACAGEGVLVFNCGREENVSAGFTRYVRLTIQPADGHISLATEKPPTEQRDDSIPTPSDFQWYTTAFIVPRKESFSAVALDCSKFAVTTALEDTALYRSRAFDMKLSSHSLASQPISSLIPGQRARLVAAGTRSGRIYLWDVRAPVSQFTDIVNRIDRCRIIQTDSPVVTALALTSVFVIHGGSDGRVQAWDPLASSEEPIRTIFSRLKQYQSWETRVTSSDSPAVQRRMRKRDAANAIFVDSDPKSLRGIVAVGDQLRYWSFSSSAATESSKSYRRRLNRAARAGRVGNTEGIASARRLGLKLVVDEELASTRLDAKERQAEEKEYRKFANRFGTELLGEGASEEEMIAYAKLLSEEERLRQEAGPQARKLRKDANDAEVAAHVNSLSPEEYKKWLYASWEERFEIPASGAVTAIYNTSPVIPSFQRSHSEDEVARAIQNSLEDAQTSSPTAASSPSIQAGESSIDGELAEAICRSLAEPQPHSSTNLDPSTAGDVDDDFERAVRLSLQDQEWKQASSQASPLWSPSSNGQSSTNISYDEEFPTLGSSPTSSPPLAGKRDSKGKGRAW